jgi:flagella basal body P-ring formation protein FlgA
MENLKAPMDVARGELVHVEAHNGAARVVLTARAETAGRVGDLIAVRNLETSRVFHGRVDAKGSVVVDSGAVREP